jgi:hypothetical protein
MDEWYLGVLALLGWWFSCSFSLISAIHHTEMISFIKFLLVIRFFLLQRRLSEVSCLCCLIKLLLNFKAFDWLFRRFVLGCFFLGRRWVAYFLVYSSFSLLRWLLFARMFCIARHLAAEFWTRLAAFSVYVFFAMGGWFTSWIGAALVNFFNMLFPSDSDD